MYIDCVKNSNNPYLRVAESYSVRENGKLKNRKRTIRNIGPLSKFDDGRPDFLQRLRRSFGDGNPIIPSLSDLAGSISPPRKCSVAFYKDSDDCFSDPKNLGYFLLDALFDSLGTNDVLTLHAAQIPQEHRFRFERHCQTTGIRQGSFARFETGNLRGQGELSFPRDQKRENIRSLRRAFWARPKIRNHTKTYELKNRSICRAQHGGLFLRRKVRPRTARKIGNPACPPGASKPRCAIGQRMPCRVGISELPSRRKIWKLFWMPLESTEN